MPPSSKLRLYRLLRGILIFAALGVGYALFCFHFGYGVPCLFNLITGLKCPGCGVTRMCLCLLRLDIGGAWEANPALLVLLPFGLLLGLRLAVRYVKSGGCRLTRPENIGVCSACAVLLIFGVVRNIV